ncbi:MAG: retropepsin-like aspartic protease [Gammaproteobacteria bacterium]|nr:retropepsin-like aspartic protease [Gammaproteobacteria bacterium]
MKYPVAISILAVFVGGCAATTGITYRTDPPGAVISYKDGGDEIGVTPVRLLYERHPDYAENDCLRVKGITARWVDGTVTSSPDVLRVCGDSGEYEYKLSKPKGIFSFFSESKLVPVGEQLTTEPEGCLLYLDSVGISPGQMTVNFYAHNDHIFFPGEFSVNVAYANDNSEVHLSGISRAQEYFVVGKLNFSVAVDSDVSLLTLKTTCDGSAHTAEIPLDTKNIRDKIAAGVGAGRNKVKMFKSGGVYEIPVVLNGVLAIPFIIDSGASDVVISSDVALTLFRTGTIRESDYMSGAVYRLADGTEMKSGRFRLQSVRIGNKTIRGVTCAITDSLKAPMLLGQGVLERLGKYTVDYKSGVLIFE